jgi:predicted nucleic acid-binding protein
VRFWDSSAVVPLCVEEPATASLHALLKEDEAMVAWWASPIECASACARLRRDGALSEEQELNVRQRVDALAGAWTEIEPSEDARRGALRLLALHPLRASDALQLAAALTWTDRRPDRASFVCLDRRLRQAARKEGFAVLPVGSGLD